MHLFQPQQYETRSQSKKKFGQNTNTWWLNNILLKNERVNQEIKKEIKKYMETNENENIIVQNLWDAAKAVCSKREDYCNRGLHHKIKKKISNKQTLYISKEARKRRTNKSKSQ